MAGKRRKPLRRGTLGREAIIEACLRLLEREGAGGFSMPALGRELGADPSGIYRYFLSKDDLVVAVTDEFIARLKVEEIKGDCWIETLAAIARRLWSVGTGQPGVMALTGARTAALPGTFGAANHIIGTFAEGGFGPEDSARLYRAFVDSFLALTQQDALLLDLGAEAQSKEAQSAFRGVDPERYPHIASAAETVATNTAEENFELTLSIFLEGVAAHAPRPCADHPHSLRPLPGAAPVG